MNSRWKANQSQQKAMEKEIRRQILEWDEKHSMDVDSAILWALHESFGFGKKRLRRFWESVSKLHRELRDYYQMDPEDNGWICRQNLKKIGVDVEDWYRHTKP